MKSPTWFTLLSLGVLLAGVAGCGRESAETEEATPPHPIAAHTLRSEQVPHEWPPSDSVPADRLAWRRLTLGTAYDQVGEHDARWDAAAREALEALAVFPVGTDTNAYPRFQAGVQRAVESGCTDPLIRYLNLRFAHGNAEQANAAGADAYREAGDRLMHSEYPDIRRFMGAIRAAEAWSSAHGTGTNQTPVLSLFRRGAYRHLLPVLQTPDVPFDEAFESADELRRAITWNPNQEHDFLPVLIDCFQSRWPNEARGLTLCGRANERLAWNARGSGYAGSVTEAGWKEFSRYLAEAARCLEKSWQLNPKLADTAVVMMNVELGQGEGRQRMELWFRRAMALDPECYDAAYAKAWYLQPKWHGSAWDAIQFGRECVRSKEWKGRVPLVLWEAHRMLANDKATGLKDAYWKQPKVWGDVRDSFERFFELSPEAYGWRTDYALYAHKCGQMGVFLDQLPQMRWINHRYFGGETRFAEMVAEAEKQTGRKATLPK